MTEIITKSPAETEAFAEKLAESLSGGEVIAFRGSMGMGKTCISGNRCSCRANFSSRKVTWVAITPTRLPGKRSAATFNAGSMPIISISG